MKCGPDRKTTKTATTVSVLIPCYNEEKYIGRCLDSLLANDYPAGQLDIVVIDGMSRDRTREIVAGYADEHAHIRLMDNPRRLKPIALNLGIAGTEGDVVMRVDAHALYEPDYIRRLVEGLNTHGCDNIGGVRETCIEGSALQRAVGIAISHPFAVGNAHWRTGTEELREVDTVFCGCYRRDVFDRIGDFNERLIRTQDREFNFRLKQDGGRILLDPSIRCTYFPRTDLGAYWRWNFTGARWLFLAGGISATNQLSLRNFVPLAFFLASFLCLLTAAVAGAGLWPPLVSLACGAPVVMYGLMAVGHALQTAYLRKDPALFLPLLLVFPLTHYSYGLGSLVGLGERIGLLRRSTK